MRRRLETLAIHAGQDPDPTTGAVVTPIYQTSTYHQDEVGRNRGYEYGRAGNPTRTALEAALGALEGGDWCLAYPSGMAATASVTSTLNPGDHVILSDDVYGGTYRLFSQPLTRMGITFTQVDVSDSDAVVAAFTPQTRLVWVETPTNPYLKVADLPRLIEEAHRRGALLAVDNTFATPILQRPLELGADLVVHSTTKYVGGHSDLLGGAVIGRDQELHDALYLNQKTVGAIPGPMDCFLALRGLKTLSIRMERHCRNAAVVANHLAARDEVTEVFFPGLSTHPSHQLASRQMADFGGMVSFRMRGGEDAARRFVAATRVFVLAVSLGGVESLCEVPAHQTHATLAGTRFQPDPALVRLSVGIEHVDDLCEDIDQALVRADSEEASEAVGR